MKKNTMQSLADHFLVAMPGMNDPIFFEGVVYLCEHNEDGAMGVLINKPTPVMLGQLFEQVREGDIRRVDEDDIVYFGGPVQSDRGFLVHSPAGSWKSSLNLGNDMAITTSRDILAEIAKNTGPKDLLITLGCSSWSKNQLENEIASNDWLVLPANKDIMFHTPSEERYQKALSLIGIDPNSTFITKAGHA